MNSPCYHQCGLKYFKRVLTLVPNNRATYVSSFHSFKTNKNNEPSKSKQNYNSISNINLEFLNLVKEIVIDIIMPKPSRQLLWDTRTLHCSEGIYVAPILFNKSRSSNNNNTGLSQKTKNIKSEINYKFSSVIDENISELLTKKDPHKAIKLFHENILLGSCRSMNIIVSLSKEASIMADVKTMNKLQDVARKCFPVQFKKFRELKEYEAICLCYGGNCQGAFNIILQQCEKYKNRRDVIRKIRSCSELLIYKVISFNNIQLEIMTEEFCLTLCKKYNQKSPLASLWKNAIESEEIMHHQLADRLLDNHIYLRNHIIGKVPTVINNAVTTGNKQLLNRLIQTLIKLKHDDYVILATSALLTINCDDNDYLSAEKTIRFANELDIPIEKRTFSRYLMLLSLNFQPINHTTLLKQEKLSKIKAKVSVVPNLKYKF